MPSNTKSFPLQHQSRSPPRPPRTRPSLSSRLVPLLIYINRLHGLHMRSRLYPPGFASPHPACSCPTSPRSLRYTSICKSFERLDKAHNQRSSRQRGPHGQRSSRPERGPHGGERRKGAARSGTRGVVHVCRRVCPLPLCHPGDGSVELLPSTHPPRVGQYFTRGSCREHNALYVHACIDM